MNRQSPRHASLLWLLPLLILIAALLFHAQYSFCQSDEPFYISTAKRLSQGDRLIIDEWHPTQFYAPLLVPFYRLHRAFAGGDAGVLLFFRRLFIVFQGGICVAFFFALRKSLHSAAAMLISALCLMYSRANIAGPSYYNLSMLFLLLFWVLYSLNSVPGAVLAGLCISAAVLCQPWLAPFLVAMLMFFTWHSAARRFALSAWLAVFTSALSYLFMLFSRASLPDILSSIRYVMEDPMHVQSLIEKLRGFLSVLSKTLPIPFLAAVIVMCLAVLIAHRRHLSVDASALWWLQLLLAAVSLITPLFHPAAVPCFASFFSLAVALLPALLYALLNHSCHAEPLLVFLGFSLMAAFFLGSNTGLDAMTGGACLISAAGLAMLFGSIPPMSRKAGKIALYVLCAALLLFASAQRFLGFYRDAPLDQLTVRLKEGPAKGLMTSEENARQYNDVLDVIVRLESSHPDATVMHSLRVPWAYLCADWRCAAPSTWTVPVHSERLADYIHQHDDRSLDFVFVYEPTFGQYQSVPLNNHEAWLDPNAQDLSGAYWETLKSSASIIHDDPCVTVYSSIKKSP